MLCEGFGDGQPIYNAAICQSLVFGHALWSGQGRSLDKVPSIFGEIVCWGDDSHAQWKAHTMHSAALLASQKACLTFCLQWIHLMSRHGFLIIIHTSVSREMFDELIGTGVMEFIVHFVLHRSWVSFNLYVFSGRKRSWWCKKYLASQAPCVSQRTHHSFKDSNAGRLWKKREEHWVCEVLYSECNRARDHED